MLTLRSFEHKDISPLVGLLNQPNMTDYMSSRIPQPYCQEDATWWVNTGCHQGVIRAVEYQGELIGCVGAEPGPQEYSHTYELGYWFAPKVWNQGIATRAVKMLMAQLEYNEQVVRVEATVFDGNIGSARVLEKSGFVLDGVFKKAVCKHGRFFDTLKFSKVLR